MAERNLVLQLLITAKDQASGIVSGFVSSAKTQFAALTAAVASAFSFKEAASFEKALDAIRARADETGPALEALIGRAKEAAQTLGPEFGFSATEAAGGIKELVAAGFSADDSLKALKGTLALAAMEEISVAKAAVMISDAIAQFGLKAEDASTVADILAKAAGAVAATATDMAEALKYTGNEASRSGLSLKETAATLDVLAKAGQRGSEAGTGLASVLAILNNPAHAATQALFDLGATSTELSNVLDFLDQRGINASQTIALFGEQGGRVINTLLAQGGSKAIAEFAEKIGAAGKSAEETAKIMQGNFLGALDRFWESLKRVGVELATPKLEPFAKGLDTLTAALNSFASNDRIQAFQKTLADGFSAAYNKVRAFSVDIDWSGIKNSINGAFGAISTAVDKALDSLGSIYSSLTGTLPGAANIGKQAGELFKAAWDGIGQIADGVASGIERIAQALGGSVAPSAQQAKTALDGVTESTTKQATGFQSLWQALKTDALDGLKSTWDSLTRGAADLLAGVNSLAQKGSEFLAGFIRSADFGPLRDLFNAVADAAKRLAATIAESFPRAQGAGETFANSFTIAWSGVVGILAAVVSGTLKVVEAIGRATFEVGKYFNRYSDAEIAKIEANLNGLSESAGEFAGVAARSFEASGKAMDRMRGNAEGAAKQQQQIADAAKAGAEAQKNLAQATAEQAAKQTDAVEKTKQFAEAIQLQQAEVKRLATADQTAEGAKQAHAAATQKLWAMQGDFIESVKVLNGEQYKSAAANDAVKATITTLNATMEEGRAKLEGYTPTLEDLRQTMEKTRQELERVEEAQKKGTLTATKDKSITEQVNEAKKKASDALGAYNSALDRNITNAETAIKTAARQREAHEAVAKSGEALIEASIRLAEIEGNANRVAELTAQKKAEQAEAAKKTADSYWKESEAAAKSAEALQLKYEALLKTDPLNKEAIAKAKESADSARAEAQATKASAIEMAAKIPVMEKEAQQAAIMAGPIGQLTRLYAEQTKEHQRAADASEQYYSVQLKEIEGAIKVAQARGDEAEVAKLQAKQQKVLIEQAEALSAAKATEAADAQKAVDAKALELAADGELSKADKEQIANLQAVADQKKAAAKEAELHAEALQKESDALKQVNDEAKVFDNAAQNAYKFSDAAEDVARRNKEVSETAEKAKNSMEGVNVTLAKFGNQSAIAFGEEGVRRFEMVIRDIQSAINEADIAAERLANEGLRGVGNNANDAALYVEDLANNLDKSESYLNDAARAASENLRQALADARAEAEAMVQSLAEAADATEKEILRLQGKNKEVYELEHQEKLRQLEEEYKKAGELGDAEYRRAKAAEDALHALKLKQLQEQADADAQKNANHTETTHTTVSSGSAGVSSPTINVNVNAGNARLLDSRFKEELARDLKPIFDDLHRRLQ